MSLSLFHSLLIADPIEHADQSESSVLLGLSQVACSFNFLLLLTSWFVSSWEASLVASRLYFARNPFTFSELLHDCQLRLTCQMHVPQT